MGKCLVKLLDFNLLHKKHSNFLTDAEENTSDGIAEKSLRTYQKVRSTNALSMSQNHKHL
jgi:hypothetical protein